MVRNQDYIYIAPSLELLKEKGKKLKTLGVNATAITSENHPGNITPK